jgi:broad specificity phosphatase PhoE
MKELKISPDFTIEDIHQIREWNYERYQHMSNDEIKKEREQSVDWFKTEINKRRASAKQ